MNALSRPPREAGLPASAGRSRDTQARKQSGIGAPKSRLAPLWTAPLAVRESKIAMDDILDSHMNAKDAFARGYQSTTVLASTPDFKEGPRAFIEKRPPRWTGRRSAL